MRHSAIYKIHPNVITIIDSEPMQILDAEGNDVVINEASVQVEQDRLQEEFDAQKYARNRRPLYPAIGDQLDALYHAGVFPDEMAAKLKKVKDDNPKP